MREIRDYIIRGFKYGYRTISGKKFLNPECDCNRQSANDKLYNLLQAGKPCMIARFGTTEINCINNYLTVHSSKPYYRKCIDYITDYTHTPWWNKNHFPYLSIYSGIFPPTKETAEKFSERYLQDIPEIDLLACHQYFERFMPLKENVIKIQLETLYPFFVERPWTRILKGKKVLVVHPFEDTIRKQYQKRRFLFDSEDILPDFELKTLKAIQSVGGNKVDYKDWFEALAWMEKEMDKIDYDITIIGCGAYGLPLAAHAKRRGKQAVHMAGGTQMLFGIKGKRWVEQYANILEYRPNVKIDTNYRKLFNDFWTYPLAIDKPTHAEKVEDACYW